MNKLLITYLSAIIIFTLSSCYYDIEEELYPNSASNTCETTNLSYSQDIDPILRSACYSCHGFGIGLGNVTLEGFSNLQAYINDGSLIGSVDHGQGFSPMPKGGTKLSDCSINKIKVWVNTGASNN